jgi:RecA-family ATPase
LRISLTDLAGKLDILDLVGHSSTLWNLDRNTRETRTAAYWWLKARMNAYETEVLIVDGINDTFGGNEIDRTEVKSYINSLLALIPLDRGALFLIGHVNKVTTTNAVTSEGYSGSTQWHNGVRSRLYLYPETESGEEERRPERTGRLILTQQKSNYGSQIDRTSAWRWDDTAHMFLPELGLGSFDRSVQKAQEERGILLAFKGCALAGIDVPAATTGPRTAFHVLSSQPIFPETLKDSKPCRARFWRHVEKLRAARCLEERSMTSKFRNKTAAIYLTDKGMRECEAFN